MFHFLYPWAILLLLLPLLVMFLLPPAAHQGVALKVPFYQQIEQSDGNKKYRRNIYGRIILVLCWILLTVAIARPQWLGEYGAQPVSGRDLMLAVDVSGSMKAQDMIYQQRPQDRLSAVKRVAGNFIERRRGDRIGLILFGTRAYLQAPLSLDRTTVNQLLQESAIGIAGEKTAIGDAIGLALKRLKDRPGDEKVLILLTDGTNTAGEFEPGKAAEIAATADLRIHTIGVGSDGRQSGSFFGANFFRQRSDLDESTLRRIAQRTGGQYFRATDSESLEKIYALIDQLELVEDDETNLRPVNELFYLPLGLALLLSFLGALIRLVKHLQIGDFFNSRKMNSSHNSITVEANP